MSGRVWTDALVTRLASLAAQGLSASEIGDSLGQTKNAVVGAANRAGIPLAGMFIPGGPKPAVLQNLAAQVRALRDAGVAHREIARRLRVGTSTVTRIVDRFCMPNLTSPIQKRDGKNNAAPLRPGAATAAPLASATPIAQSTAAPVAAASTAVSPGSTTPDIGFGTRGCQYIHDTGPWLRRTPEFCGASRKDGSPYCAAHHRLCYTRWPTQLNAADGRRRVG